MKTSISKISAALILVAAATSANAQSDSPVSKKWYGEIGYNTVNYEEPGADADLGVLTGTLGYEVNKNFSVEAMLGTGVTDDDVTVNVPPPVTVNVDVDNSYAVYLKPKMQLGQNVEVFAKLGWAKTKLEVSAGAAAASDSGSDFAYGAGLQYSITPTAYVTGSYMNLYDKDSVSVDGWSIGVGFKF